MASVNGEAVIGKICKMAIDMAVPKLAEAANLIEKFREDFRWLREELISVRCFLEDADQQSRHDGDVKQWLLNLQDIAMHAEDISEVCAVESMYGNDVLFGGFSFRQWIFRYKIGGQIRDVKVRMTNITEKANQLSLRRAVLAAHVPTTSEVDVPSDVPTTSEVDVPSDVPTTSEVDVPTTSQVAPVNRSRLSFVPRYSHPVGIQPKVDRILSWLNDTDIPLIAVVGMGGLGKTFLLQHVFSMVKERYEKSIWLSVSQSYSISSLQKDIASHLDLELEGVSKEKAAELIREKLQCKKCLVVLDDVWDATREGDLLDTLGLPCDNSSSCRILVSTRSKDICKNLHAEIYEMQCLSDEESWSLFSFYAFRDYVGNKAAQQQLEEEGRKIVKQCGNLPLAIRTIAASLANTRDPSKWKWKFDQLEQVNLSAAENESIMAILKLSYDSLPRHLKACFAYLSFFSEDEEIDPEYLISLWIGEGFIPAGEHQLDEAWDCLHQLANLCLLQLCEPELEIHSTMPLETVWDCSARLERKLFCHTLIKQCKIHDLVLDLAIQISRENRCAFSAEEADALTSDGTACFRILLAKKLKDVNAISKRPPVCLRTLSFSQNRSIERIPENLFSAMSGLRILDLSGTGIYTLPASVGEMKLLKVLNLRRTNVSEVPDCVKHLKSLFFLALPFHCKRLPVWISNLKCLQHLECEEVDKMPKGISKVASLRTLRSGFLTMFQDLGNMTQLQELWLQVNDEMESKRMEEVGIFSKLVKMRSLALGNRNYMCYRPNSREIRIVPENMLAMKHLESLVLFGLTVPRWICGFENLRELCSIRCNLNIYPELQGLSNLVLLRLSANVICTELPKGFGKMGGFPHLRFFLISEFRELEEFPDLEEGAMACLEVLSIKWCGKLKRVGEGLEQLKTLKELYLFESGVTQVREAFREGGQYHNKMKANNPQVKIIVEDW